MFLDNLSLGFIDSLSYTFPDESPWEWRKGQRVPKMVDVTLTFKILHEETPHKDSGDFYGYYPTLLKNYTHPETADKNAKSQQ